MSFISECRCWTHRKQKQKQQYGNVLADQICTSMVERNKSDKMQEIIASWCRRGPSRTPESQLDLIWILSKERSWLELNKWHSGIKILFMLIDQGFLKKYIWLCQVLVGACGLSCPAACEILVLWPGIKPGSPALEGEFLTTGPPGKPLDEAFTLLYTNCFIPLRCGKVVFSGKRVLKRKH